MRVLIVEDDLDIAAFLQKGLSEQSYAVDHVTDGESALYQTSFTPYDAIILDWMIPAPDGMEVCRRLREEGSTAPVLVLTARDAMADKITGLDTGADDYLTKPFDFTELVARLRALIRRGGAKHPATLQVADLEIDTGARRVKRRGRLVDLTSKEYALLEYLARNAGVVVSRGEICEHVWNESLDAFSNVIEVYINRLRKSLARADGPALIHTIRGAGYILEGRPETTESASPP